MTLYAHSKLLEQATLFKRQRAGASGKEDAASAEQRLQEERRAKAMTEDQVHQFALRLLLEDLCIRLQNVRPHDIIRIVGVKLYGNEPSLNVLQKRNNFFFIGAALRLLLSGGRVHFCDASIRAYRKFVECTDVPHRERLFRLIKQHKPPLAIKYFD